MTDSNNNKVLVRHYTQPAFLICAAVLALAGASMSMAIKHFGLYLQKEPLPLRKSLDLLDSGGMGNYKVVAKEKIENREVIKTLGTEDYIQWIFEDTQAQPDSSTRYCLLFITYYGLPDVVPHVPEECYTGSGNQRQSSEGVFLNIESLGGQVPVRYLVFSGASKNLWQSEVAFPVLYLFRVNGEYGSSREDVRLALNKNVFGKYSYFSKVEWKFYNPGAGGSVYPTRDEALEASKKLLEVILPVLESEHWPVVQE